ncbi:MAG: ABC transporter substrate-binding protein [Candidatus Brocadiaceae bacterium]
MQWRRIGVRAISHERAPERGQGEKRVFWGSCVLLVGLALVVPVWSGCSNDPYPPAEGKKIVYGVLGEDPHGLDPVQTGDTLSAGVAAQIYEALYEYHFLKRPYELKPALAAEMPRVSEDRLTYTIPIKKGVYFQDDPCFTATGGKGREVTAGDFVYSIKRLADAGNKPRGWWLLQGKILGLDEFHEESVERKQKNEGMDYSRPVEGLKAADRYTLRIRLTEPYPQLKYALAMTYTAATPREAVEFYGPEFHNHPVGTGPFRLKEWSKRWRLILERNPTYREDFYPTAGDPEDRRAGLLEDAGKRIPFVDGIYYTIMYEAQPAWLYFKQGYRDISGISKDFFEEAITPQKELTGEFRQRGITLTKMVESDVFYVGFSMEDEVVGTNRKLRQAMSLAYDTEWRIEHFHNGRALSAQSPIAPGIFGYDPDYRNPYKQYDLEKARRLLAEAGYPEGKDENGKPLVITYDIGSSGPAALQRAQAFMADMKQIGIRVEIRTNTWAEFLRKIREARTQVFSLGWILDYPDPENFLQLLYGPNRAPGPNSTLYDNPEYNRLFEEMKAMQNTPERYRIIRRMVDIVVEDAVWIPSVHSVSYVLKHRWVENVKPHGITGGYTKYRDIDAELRDRLRREWNRPNYMVLAAVAVVLGGVPLVLVLLGGNASGRVRQP